MDKTNDHEALAARYRALTRMVTRHRLSLGLLIVVTALAPAFFVRLQEPTTALNVYKLPAKIGSLVGTMLLFWQFVLGFRGFPGPWFPDVLWQIDWHKRIGRWSVPLILLHPVFISLYYLDKHGVNLWTFPLSTADNWYVALGLTAFVLILLIVATSVFFRQVLGAKRWYLIHVCSYLVLPLIFIHSYPLGMTIAGSALRLIWPVLAGAYLVVVVWRLWYHLQLGRHHYVVEGVAAAGEDVVEISLRPRNGAIEPLLGQFIYFRRHFWGRTRPYTVTAYDPESGCLAVAIKAQNDTSVERQSLAAGEQVFLDGPYGTFTWEAFATRRPVVMAAGGIGITAFLRAVDALAETGHEMSLFYGNPTRRDIAFGERLAAVPGLELVHVLSDEPEHDGASGFITRELLERRLPRPLPAYEFLICGPPVMIRKLEAGLVAAGIPRRQIHHELFDY